MLEHVEEPEAFLAELVRVTKPGGKVVVSSPNFFRALGLRDYHPRMRGIGNKWRNWQRLRAKRRQMAAEPESVRFDRMEPIRREPFQPDDDAIVATNGVEIKFFLEQNGCDVLRVECTDRYRGQADRLRAQPRPVAPSHVQRLRRRPPEILKPRMHAPSPTTNAQLGFAIVID